MRASAIKMTIDTENHAPRGRDSGMAAPAATRHAAYLGVLSLMFAVGALVALARLGRF